MLAVSMLTRTHSKTKYLYTTYQTNPSSAPPHYNSSSEQQNVRAMRSSKHIESIYTGTIALMRALFALSSANILKCAIAFTRTHAQADLHFDTHAHAQSRSCTHARAIHAHARTSRHTKRCLNTRISRLDRARTSYLFRHIITRHWRRARAKWWSHGEHQNAS